MREKEKKNWHRLILPGAMAEAEEKAGGEKSDSKSLLVAWSILLFCKLFFVINNLLYSKPRCSCHEPQPSVLQHVSTEWKGCTGLKQLRNGLGFFSYSQAKNQMPVKNGMLNISTFRHALNCKYMSNPNGFSFGDFNSCMVFITTGKTLSNKLPVWLPVVLHHNYWNIFGISQEVQIMKNPPNFLLAQT